MSIRLLVPLWILPYLRLIEPLQRLYTALPVPFFLRQATLHDRLGEERNVP